MRQIRGRAPWTRKELERLIEMKLAGMPLAQIAFTLGRTLSAIKCIGRKIRPSTRRPCQHCGKTGCLRPRQLCWRCYEDVSIRNLYLPQAGQGEHGAHCHDAEPDSYRHQERQPGDGVYRCLWCMQWACWEPLRLCGKCSADYQRRAVGMPARGREDDVV